MIIADSDLAQTAAALLQIRQGEQTRLRKINAYMRGKHDPPYAPKGAGSEYRWLMKRSRRNFLPLITSVISQNLHVDGYKRSGQTAAETVSTEQPEPAWDAFRANRMISRQHGVHRAVVKHGYSYVVVLPGSMKVGEQAEEPVPIIRPASARNLTALYADPINDEWPQLAVEYLEINDPSVPGKVRVMVTLYDEKSRYILMGTQGSNGIALQVAESDDPFLDGKPPVADHGMGLCPVVRFLYEDDLDGEDCTGEIEPLITIQDQINFTTFNEMMAEQFAAFRQRWVTGIASEDEQGRQTEPFRPGIDRMFASDDAGTRFGEFDVTPLQPYLDSRESTIRHMSTVSQVPPYHLLGQIANLSAEALAAARDGLDRKIEEEQAMLTDSWRNTFRLASKAANDDDGWNDLNGTVIWRDTSARSFAATIDALGKASQMLGVPQEELWRRIPGVTADDVADWLAARQRALAQATAEQAQKTALAVQSQLLNSPYPPPAGSQPGGPQPGQGPGAPAGQNGAPSQQAPANPELARAQAMLAQGPPAGPGGKPAR